MMEFASNCQQIQLDQLPLKDPSKSYLHYPMYHSQPESLTEESLEVFRCSTFPRNKLYD